LLRWYWASRSASRFWCAGDLVGHVEQTLEPLAVEPVGEHDRVVLELADHPRVERGERGPGRRLALGHQPLLGDRQLVEPLADLRQRLAQRIGRVWILLERRADRAELDHRLAQLARQLVARRRLVAERQPAAEVLQDLLGQRLLAAERVLVALARAHHLEVELARPPDVGAADRVIVLGLDPVPDLAAARHLELGDVPHQLALDPAARHRRAAGPGSGERGAGPARVQRDRLLALVPAGLPHQLGRRDPEVVLDHVGELDPAQRG